MLGELQSASASRAIALVNYCFRLLGIIMHLSFEPLPHLRDLERQAAEGVDVEDEFLLGYIWVRIEEDLRIEEHLVAGRLALAGLLNLVQSG